jgi:hypothetical protein
MSTDLLLRDSHPFDDSSLGWRIRAESLIGPKYGCLGSIGGKCGDAAIRFFGQVTVVKSSGNEVAGGRSDLTTGVVTVSNIGFIPELPKD